MILILTPFSRVSGLLFASWLQVTDTSYEHATSIIPLTSTLFESLWATIRFMVDFVID